WTHKHFSPSAFSAWQAKQGAKGGKVSKRKPVQGSEAQVKPWEALGISRAWYYKKKKLGEI
ncbi:replicase, partial [Vibrio cholerae]